MVAAIPRAGFRAQSAIRQDPRSFCALGGERQKNIISRETRCLPSFEGLNFLFFPLPTAIVGPPKLSWLLQDQILSVNIVTPLTPYQRRTGSYKPVDRVLLKLWYWLHLYEGNLLVQQVCGSWAGPRAAGLAQTFLVQQSHHLRLQWCGGACASALPTPGCACRCEVLCTPSLGLPPQRGRRPLPSPR